MLIPSDVHAEIDGTPLTSSEDIRLTEYTVGPAGRAQMPGELPPLTGYTYAVELAVAGADADDVVEFKNSDGSDAEVAFYVENFIGFPVGEIVPAGYWDRDRGSWIPSDNGCVIEITDSDGDGTAEVTANTDSSHQCHVSNLGIDSDEKDKLGTVYSAELSGDGSLSLWRTPMTHFTPWDCNFPWGPPPDALPPEPMSPVAHPQVPDPCNQSGSIIECENQVLGESIDLPKTDTSLNYRTSNMAGFAAARSIDVPLIGEEMSTGLTNNPDAWIEVTLEVAGQTQRAVYSDTQLQTDLTHTFSWDGKDHLGRELRRSVPYEVEVSYVYPGVQYREPADFERSFAQAGADDYSTTFERTGSDESSPLVSLLEGGDIPQITARQSRTYTGRFDGANLGGTDIGGWQLEDHHTLDIDSKQLIKGDGTRTPLKLADPAVETAFDVSRYLHDVETGPGKSIHVLHTSAYWGYGRISIIGADGSVETKPLSEIDFKSHRMAVSPSDGTIFTVETVFTVEYNRIHRAEFNENTDSYDLEQITDTSSNSVDIAYGMEGDASKIDLATVMNNTSVKGMEFNADGELYFLQSAANIDAIFKLSYDRSSDVWWMSPVTGCDAADSDCVEPCSAGDNTCEDPVAHALETNLSEPTSLAFEGDGGVVFSEEGHRRVRRLSTDGTIETLAGNGGARSQHDPDLEGQDALTTPIGNVSAVAVAGDGRIYFQAGDNRIYRIEDSVLRHVSGTGDEDGTMDDGAPATATEISSEVNGLEFGPKGSLYYGDFGSSQLRSIFLPGRSLRVGDEYHVPSRSGEEVYIFDLRGLHQKTVDSITGVELYNFGRNSDDRLTSITAADGSVTTIERDTDGMATAIEGSFGHRYELTYDYNGYLESVERPDTLTNFLNHDSSGVALRSQ